VIKMDLQEILHQKKLSKYQLSKISKIPKTTVIDICSGKSAIEYCSAKTVRQLALALDLSMENVMELSIKSPKAAYNKDTGLPNDKSYFECGLPTFLQNSLSAIKKSWETIDSGGEDYHFDIFWCDLSADINSAEIDRVISYEQAWYLRQNYLRMERND